MEPSTQKLIHTFGALADLGQEIAGTGDFSEMVRTSMHLLLGALALRRGAGAECSCPGPLGCAAVWGLTDKMFNDFELDEAGMQAFLAGDATESLVKNSSSSNSFITQYRDKLTGEGRA